MGGSFLLSKDEPLIPNIDGGMALWIFRRRAQNMKFGRKLPKIGPPDPSFYFFVPAPSSVHAKPFQGPHWQQTKPLKKSERRGPFWSLRNKIPTVGTGHFLIQIHLSALWVASLTSFFGLRRTTEHRASYRNVISMTLTTFRSNLLQFPTQAYVFSWPQTDSSSSQDAAK